MDTASNNTKLDRDVAHYLATGECDPLGCAFPGRDSLECITGYEQHLRNALINEVRRSERDRRQTQIPPDFNASVWTRRKVEPMITGLFPAAERHVLLGMAERSIVFLTRDATFRVLLEIGFLESAWKIASIYLHSLGAPLLGDDSQAILGMNEETTCYVSMEYFDEKDRFADYVVHEVAHIFHNCKRSTLGLPHSRKKEWLLDIAFAKRETFAYACEAYSRIREQAHGPAQRSALLAQYAAGPRSSDERVCHDELIDILSEAIAARNGWKRILARCSVPQRHGQRQDVVSDHHFSGSNPFGHSSTNLGSLYKGLVRSAPVGRFVLSVSRGKACGSCAGGNKRWLRRN
jgi:hypothetical protein